MIPTSPPMFHIDFNSIEHHSPHIIEESGVDSERFLSCILAIEGNNWNVICGGYGLTSAVWYKYTSTSYGRARDPNAARYVAMLHLKWLQKHLKNAGYKGTVYELAACWRYGLEGGKRKFGHKNQCSYAQRTENLYLSYSLKRSY